MDRVGPYRIEQQLLSTGFSDIYIAFKDGEDAPLAVKVFHPKGKNVGSEAKYGPEFWRVRFIEEGKVLAGINHPNIVPVIDQGELDTGEPYFVMPFMEANLLYEIGDDPKRDEDGTDNSDKWRPRPLSPRRAVEIWRQLLAALAHLHRIGLVHRDVKPPNIMLDKKIDGRVLLGDFGMVKVPGAEGSRSGIWIGTLDYISPEQRKSAKEVGSPSDVYSAGVVMYRMLTGTLPGRRPVPLRAGRLDVPTSLVDLVNQCLRRRPPDRPEDAGALLASLDTCVPRLSDLSDESKIVRRQGKVTLKIQKKNV